MVGIYFSGTGNTRHCVEFFVKQYDEQAEAFSIEDSGALAAISAHDTVVLGYPVYFSNAPKIVRDFILRNGEIFAGKKVFVLATMAMASGDGAGCAARLLKRCGAKIIGGLHLRMPDNIGDERVLKNAPLKNQAIVLRAEGKITLAAQKLKQGAATRDGLNIWRRAAGLLGQRLWFYAQTASCKNKPVINQAKCTGCGVCAGVCPMQNLTVADGKAVSRKRCTLCYRCFSRCPAKALMILGRTVHQQYTFASCSGEGGHEADLRNLGNL